MDVTRKKTPPDDPGAPLAAIVAALAADWPDTQLRAGQSRMEVGLSGGVDSVVLLTALAPLATARGVRLGAVHVHHGLSPNADHWAAFCAGLCARLGVPLRVERVTVLRGGGKGLEAAARHARYRALMAGGADVVVLGHHADDQAETVLLQALRGGGARALAAMPVLRAAGGCWLWRPLLRLGRQDIVLAARAAGLDWIEDESNSDPRYRRNAVRHALVPLLADHFPDYRRQLARTAARAADEAAVLADVVAQSLPALTGPDGALALGDLLARSRPWQRLLLAGHLERCAVAVSPALLDALLDQATGNFELRVGDRVLFGYRWRLHVRRDWTPPTAGVVLPLVEGDVRIPGWAGILRVRRVMSAGLALPDGARIEVCAGRDGETLSRPVGHKACRKIWQEAGHAPWLRHHWPRLWFDGVLIALPGVAEAASHQVGPGEAGWVFDWVECRDDAGTVRSGRE